MILGIVGSHGAKFTPETETEARVVIRKLLLKLGTMDAVCSGHCPEGGIDIYAEEEADKLGIEKIIYAPTKLQWGGKGGYQDRNRRIATTSDHVVCITVREVPKDYKGMTFASCYHHDDEPDVKPHVKSGGCWTTKYARALGKTTELIII